MGISRNALNKFMNSFDLSLDFLPEKKDERDHGTRFCNVINVYKGDSFYTELRICNVMEKDGSFSPFRSNYDWLMETLRDSMFVYLGAEDVLDEFFEISKEYTQKLIEQGNFDD